MWLSTCLLTNRCLGKLETDGGVVTSNKVKKCNTLSKSAEITSEITSTQKQRKGVVRFTHVTCQEVKAKK